jgi:O-methyltransferase involved in polyketide biosynthesis
MEIPATLQWVEVDFPEIVSYKQEILGNEKPKCSLERVSLDLSDVPARRTFFAEMNARAKNIVVMTEGLLIYFTPEDVASLARDIAAAEHIRSWLIDLASPGQLKLMQRSTGKQLSEADAAFRFGPAEGANFFSPHGWDPKDVQGFLKTAAQLGRAPAELLALLPEPKVIAGNYPWSGVCQLKRR